MLAAETQTDMSDGRPSYSDSPRVVQGQNKGIVKSIETQTSQYYGGS